MKLALALCLFTGTVLADSNNPSPPFSEIYQTIESHLAGVNTNDLNRAAVTGLLAQLNTNVMLVSGDANSSATPVLGANLLYDDSYAYFRVLKVESSLPADLANAYKTLSETNKSKIKGVVLDLRYATGSDYTAAAAAADCFLNSDQPLLESNGQMARSTKKDTAITVPLAILINGATSEAAEALAAVLRETSTGLTLGSPTAGRANIFQEFPLSNGDKLRVAVGQIKLADGNIFSGGLRPDIAVDVNTNDERAYWESPYQTPPLSTNNPSAAQSNTNLETYQRYSEAQLVREQREGADLEAEFTGRASSEPARPLKTIKDPALARALDLLKGLAVVQQGHPG